MSKKKKIVLILTIISCIILSFIGGQSYSKYVSEVKGNGVAEVARWDFNVNNEGGEQLQTIQLGQTYDEETLLGNKIAPGTKGSFTIAINADNSDVGINYYVQFQNETQKPTNLKFFYDNQEYANIENIVIAGIIQANESEKRRDITIDWAWDYEMAGDEEDALRYDINDTEDAKNIQNYTFDVIVSGVQVEPQQYN